MENAKENGKSNDCVTRAEVAAIIESAIEKAGIRLQTAKITKEQKELTTLIEYSTF